MLYKLIYFCLIDKKGHFYVKKIPTFYLKTICKQYAIFFGENTILKVC